MGKPAARIGDMHNCPAVSPGGVPHAGGQIVGPGGTTVWIEGAPAATAGDVCLCVGGVDKIVTGSTGVFIEGRPAARHGDRCAHGGVVVGGSVTVFIGEKVQHVFFSRPKRRENKDCNEEFVEPPQEEKNRMIGQAIEECIFLLETKLELLVQREKKTMEDFKKWFGSEEEEAIDLILNRIRKALDIAKVLTLDDFGIIKDEKTRRDSFARVYDNDEFHTINLGDLFWKDNEFKNSSRAATLVHELSHFDDIGTTEDFEYGSALCLHISKYERGKALYNAENFEYYISA